ncbi:MAG: glycoside hydrolase family 3 N-terminal domain-containing protein [Calditrichia bacterium]
MPKNSRYLLPFLLILFMANVACRDKSNPLKNNAPEEVVYKDASRPVAQRVDDLLARMTLQEKIGQMTQAERQALQNAEEIRTLFLGSLLSGGGSAPASNMPAEWADMYDRYQSQALKTRLGIPLIYGIDAVHGHNNVYGAVIFPHNIGLGCTRNPDLVEQAMGAVAEEVAGTGIDWTFAPCIAVPRDERWGRTYEGFGETPEITIPMARAAVAGFQGSSLSDPLTILACAKHFLGDGGTTGGHDQGNTEVDEQTLRQIHLPGYQAAVEQGVGSIMVSFSSWNGQKMHGSHYLLTDVLKGELGFEGFLISDWAAIDQLSGDYKSDIEVSINAGLDMIMAPDKFRQFMQYLEELVNEGRVPLSRIDDAVRRILRIKFMLGLFEQPFTERQYTGGIGSPAHREIARRCVRESLVLLQNNNQVLPLSKSLSRLHVAGKNADNLGNQCGGWSITWQGSGGPITRGTTILQGIKNAVSPETQVTYSLDGSGAAGADAAVVVIGETPYAEGAGDRSELYLEHNDLTAIQNLKNTGIPVVVILISGRPLIIDYVLPICDAFMAAWLPGTEGDGVADVLFGDFAPRGKLSHSWPRSMDQIPLNVGDPGYDPLFPYGFGLSY